jgi:hypothetical protein
MLDRAYKLRQVGPPFYFHGYRSTHMMHCPQPINLFLQTGDSLYGPITTIRQNGRITKKIPWSAFKLTDKDWKRVKDARDILKVGRSRFIYFTN